MKNYTKPELEMKKYIICDIMCVSGGTGGGGGGGDDPASGATTPPNPQAPVDSGNN